MKSHTVTAILVALALSGARAEEAATTVRGYVLDSACAFIKNLNKPVSKDCAIACAKAGSPLVILADDGTIYWPISSAMPAAGQNLRLMKFAVEKIMASGKVFEKGGTRAIVIEKIEVAGK